MRDPFFKMLPRSLSNFMNAFTSADHTSYPFATTNQKDFKNLLSVYLDATLHPLLNEHDFTQEGWRIGPENPQKTPGTDLGTKNKDKLVFKGVVYNEMKGQMSDASYLYYIRFRDHIFPDIHNSGGDPKKMTDLTYSDLKSFHSSTYHPSNARIFTYGSMPLADHLEETGRHLEAFEPITTDKAIRVPANLDEGPLSYTVKGPADPLVDKEMQYKTSVSWLMGDTSNILENFSLRVLSSLLLDGYGSPLYRGLVETGLGPDWSPNTGYDDNSKIGIFSVGLSGVRASDVTKVKEAIRETLAHVHARGFDKSKVEGILHQLELGLRHKTANFGMSLMQRVQPGWFNGVDPFDALAWNDTVSSFKTEFAKDGYLEGLLEKYLLNDRTLTFTMEPFLTYGDELAAEESNRLLHKISEVSREAGSEKKAEEQLAARELSLLDAQESARDQDLSCLPTVRVKDIPCHLEPKRVRFSSMDDVKVQWREADTNGLTYFRAINVLDGLPEELRMLIPLFTDCILRLGTKDNSMEELEDMIKLKTGGIGASYHSSTSRNNIDISTEGISLSGHALDKNVSRMFDLLSTVIRETHFDGMQAESKIRQLLQGDASGALDAVASSGHSYARRYAEAGLTPQGNLNEQIGGLTQVSHTATLAQRSTSEGLGDTISKLKTIQAFAISKSPNFRAAITCSPGAVSTNEAALDRFLTRMPETGTMPKYQQTTKNPVNRKTFFPLPYQVYYSALAMRTVPYTHQSGGPLQILSQLLTHKHLHHEIREKGGAYGGGAYSRGLSGVFGMYSYRDPNPQNTLRIMRDAGRWAYEKSFSNQDIEEAKLSVFQSVDAPESVSDEGMTRFLSGIDEEVEQKKREELLNVTKDDVRKVAQKYLIEGTPGASVAVLGEMQDWTSHTDGWVVKSLQMVEPPHEAVDSHA